MKKTILSVAALIMVASTFAQTSLPEKRDPSLGFGFFLKDFTTAQNIKTSSFGKVISNGNYAKISDMNLGIEASYYKGLTKYIDFRAIIGGCFTKYGLDSASLASNEQFLLDLNARLNFKLLSEKYWVDPYLTAGFGASNFNGNSFFANDDLGAGFEINIGKGAFVYLEAAYKFKLLGDSKNNLNYSIGYVAALPKKVVAVKPAPLPPPAPVVEKDTDGDGIVDSKDKCPTVAGVAKYNGCPIPDTDGDGINDEEDKCPTVMGLARYNGCPIPDTDGDGINDEADSCPKVVGVAKYHGCPVPDTDGDGINDDEDKCPTVPGTKENSGCPEIQKKMNELAKNVYFNTATAIISKKAIKSLDEVIVVLKANMAAKLNIEGHTDNTGKTELNKKLSQQRADAIANYLTKKGIAAGRLKATGYGDEKPIADNKTAEGKAKNRRVELRVTY